ncbi:hypothetical protein OG535_06355 [Kitasatospora sp. NBC_00085]
MLDQQFHPRECCLCGPDQLRVPLDDPQSQRFPEVGLGAHEVTALHQILAGVLEREVRQFRVSAPRGAQGAAVERIRGPHVTGVAVGVAEVEPGGDDRSGVAARCGQVERLPQERKGLLVVAQAHLTDADPSGQDPGASWVGPFGQGP